MKPEGARLRSATEEHAMRQDDGHHAVLLEVLETVQQEGKVGGGFGRQAVVLEAHVLTQRLGGLPAVAKWRVGQPLGNYPETGFEEIGPQ